MLKPSVLSQGGLVVIMRHTARDNMDAKSLATADRVGSCELKGAALNKKGLEQAEQIAKKIKQLGIIPEKVLASPACRTKQLAQTIFKQGVEIHPVLLHSTAKSSKEIQWSKLQLLHWVSLPVKQGIRFISGHSDTLELLGKAGVPHKKLSEGDAAVIKPLGDSSYKYLGIISLSAWYDSSEES